jgi:hypothetical protein
LSIENAFVGTRGVPTTLRPVTDYGRSLPDI